MRHPFILIAWFLILAVGVAVWWAAILGSQDIRERFFDESFGKGLFYLFLVPDLLAIIAGSAMVCWFGITKSRTAMLSATWFVTGAMAYATLVTISLYRYGHCTSAAIFFMAAGTVICFWLAVACARAEVSRPARNKN